MRFTGITIPQGATITSAYLNVTCHTEQSGTTVNTRISADDTDDAATFSTEEDFDTRWSGRTTARVDWDNIPVWNVDTEYTSPDIKTVIQEIVDRASWESGNDIALFWDDFEDRSTHTDYCYRQTYSYDGSTTKCSKLEITWTTAGGEAYTADLTQSLSTTWTVLTQWSATTNIAQSLTSSWQTDIEWNAITSLSQTFTTSWLVDIIHTTGAIAHIVDLTQAFATTWNILTSWNAIIDLSQVFSTSWQVLMQTDFLTSLTQAFSTSWLVDVIHTIGANQYYVDLSQAIATTWTILTQWNGIIDLTQTFGTTWTVIIQTDFITALTQAFTTSWTVEIYHWIFTGYAYNVNLTLTIITQWTSTAMHIPLAPINYAFVLAAFAIVMVFVLFGILMTKKDEEPQ